MSYHGGSPGPMNFIKENNRGGEGSQKRSNKEKEKGGCKRGRGGHEIKKGGKFADRKEARIG